MNDSVLIDLTQLPLERTGVGIYALNYVQRLRSGTDGLRLHFLVQDDDHELLLHARAVPGAVVHTVSARLFRRLPLRVLLEQIGIPLLALRASIGAVHSLHYSFPLLSFGRFKRLVTVCDMSFLLFPRLHVPVKRVFFRFFIRRLPKVDGLLYISEATMRDFHAFFPAARAADCVAQLGADLARLRGVADRNTVDALCRRFGVERFILYLGTLEPRKNVLGLVKAFERIAADYPDIKLVVAGKYGWDGESLLEYIHASPFRERIVLTGYVDEAEKHALLKSALLFAYVSLHEGFGLPVLEGMAAGVATITSNTSAMPEVAGDGALQVDPREPGQIAAAMKKLLDDASLRASLAERGMRRSMEFTWERMTATTLDFYRRVLAPGRVA